MVERIKPRAGLLPLILELYNEAVPDLRRKQQELVDQVEQVLSSSCEVRCAPICSREDQVRRAVREFEAAGCDAVVVLFTAYAPSLIAADALAESSLPVVIFNTQVSRRLDRANLPEELLRNHGMHGVQDLANLLLRRGKEHHIVTGHHSREEVACEVEEWLRACALRRYLRGASVGLMGQPFEGMGDFRFEEGALEEAFGTRVEEMSQQEVAQKVAQALKAGVDADVEGAKEEFVLDTALTADELRTSLALSRAMLETLQERGHCAWSMNFLDVGRSGVLPTVPFLAASRSLEQGYGYAGESDALSALGVFICQQLCGPSSFTEMFCMDPAEGSILLSHMGEANAALAACTPHLVHKEFAFGDCMAPAVPVFAFRPGPATLVNLVAGPGERFRFITARVEVQQWEAVLELQSPQGYIRPEKELGAFLTGYSGLGGSHHLAITYGDNASRIEKFAAVCGLETFRL